MPIRRPARPLRDGVPGAIPTPDLGEPVTSVKGTSQTACRRQSMRLSWLHAGLDDLSRRRTGSGPTRWSLGFQGNPRSGARIIREPRRECECERVSGLVSRCHTRPSPGRSSPRGTEPGARLTTGPPIAAHDEDSVRSGYACTVARRPGRSHRRDGLRARGWSELSNGELLAVTEAASFDLLLTTDQNLLHQQDLSGRRLAILVLPTTRWPQIQKHIAEIADALASIQSGEFQEVKW